MYVIDSGVRVTHREFLDAAGGGGDDDGADSASRSRAELGPDFVDAGGGGEGRAAAAPGDEDGHGTRFVVVWCCCCCLESALVLAYACTTTTQHNKNQKGTFVASAAIGRGVGVAKGARAVSVRVLVAKGGGSISDVVAGVCLCVWF